MDTSNRHPAILDRNRSALVVVDMQAPFIRSVFNSESLVSRAVDLTTACSLLKIPIICTTQYSLRMGDVVSEIRHSLPPSRTFDKMSFDCCGNGDFISSLASTGADQIILCGVESHICVCQTALSLLQSRLQVHVVCDAISSRTEANWHIGLDKMKQHGATLSSVEMALYELMRTAEDPDFKEVLKLVK